MEYIQVVNKSIGVLDCCTMCISCMYSRLEKYALQEDEKYKQFANSKQYQSEVWRGSPHQRAGVLPVIYFIIGCIIPGRNPFLVSHFIDSSTTSLLRFRSLTMHDLNEFAKIYLSIILYKMHRDFNLLNSP